MSSAQHKGTDKSCFLRIRVKLQHYSGKPSIVIFTADVTRQIWATTNERRAYEKQQHERHVANYSLLMNHELSKPLTSSFFFSEQVLEFAKALKGPFRGGQGAKDQSIKYIEMIQSQLLLTQSFIHNMTDLQQLKDGVFAMAGEMFDPAETFDLACCIFKH